MKLTEKFAKATYDTKLLDEMAKRTTATAKFKRAMHSGNSVGTSAVKQWLYDESTHIYRTIISVLLDQEESIAKYKTSDTEGAVFIKSKSAMKSFMQNTIMSKIETLGLEYKILSRDKFKWAIRVDNVDYEVSVVGHKDPIHEGTPTSIAKPAPHLITMTSWFQDYEIKVVKGNQLTFDCEGVQCSIKVTRKRSKLF